MTGYPLTCRQCSRVYDRTPPDMMIPPTGPPSQILAVFICYEMVKPTESFYAPFLDMLPRPTSITDWSSPELDELQNEYDSRACCCIVVVGGVLHLFACNTVPLLSSPGALCCTLAHESRP